MTAPTGGPLTRGPLPARVYWRRRLAVLGIALLLVLGVGRLLGSGSDGSSDDDGSASLADASVSSGTPSAEPSTSVPAPTTPTTPAAPTSTAPVLAEPDGPCVDSDIAVTPEVTSAVAGPKHGVSIDLQVRTISAEACTWKVTPRSLTLKITSGKDDIWSSRECPRAVARQDVVVRRAVTTTIAVAWNARRSDETCSKLTGWAMPGWYHVAAAALAGEPSEVQFELLAPQPVVVTTTAEPQQDQGTQGKKDKKDKKKKRDAAPSVSPSAPTEEPASTGEPSGAVEPD